MSTTGRSVLHCLRYLCGWDPAHTQTTEPERECLAGLAAQADRIVEIGVYEGATTRILANSMRPTAELFAVDPFTPGRLGICWGRLIARREAKRGNGNKNVVFVESFSHDAALQLTGTFDLVFIDGDHSMQGITTDWADWASRIRPGGHIALHDTRIPDHNRSVADLGSHQYFEGHIRHDPQFELIEQVDSLSVLRRRLP